MVPNRPSQTAEVVCLMRATDQRRPAAERIVDDPFAHLFLGPMSRAALASWQATGRLGVIAERYTPGLTTFVLARHRFIDDRLRDALEAGVTQVVILGAGYDSRAWRFAGELAGRPVFEVDYPATSRRKVRIAERNAKRLPATRVTPVEIDFQTDSLRDRLVESGFRSGDRTFFAWEGVSMYLTRAAVKATLATLRAISAPGSDVAMDFWYYIDRPDLLATAVRLSASFLHLLGEPVTFGIHPEDVDVFLERQGLRLVVLADGEELERRYVRDGRAIQPGIFLVHAVTAGARVVTEGRSRPQS